MLVLYRFKIVLFSSFPDTLGYPSASWGVMKLANDGGDKAEGSLPSVTNAGKLCDVIKSRLQQGICDISSLNVLWFQRKKRFKVVHNNKAFS